MPTRRTTVLFPITIEVSYTNIRQLGSICRSIKEQLGGTTMSSAGWGWEAHADNMKFVDLRNAVKKGITVVERG